jgi:hypothetical protein
MEDQDGKILPEPVWNMSRRRKTTHQAHPAHLKNYSAPLSHFQANFYTCPVGCSSNMHFEADHGQGQDAHLN